MFDCDDVAALTGGSRPDPRLDPEYVRCLPATDRGGAVLLIGVVHDHPASTVRVARLVGGLDPDVLALELPPLSVALFELYADEPFVPPRLGGEMSTAIQAASAATRAGTGANIVGIDAPNWTYLRYLLGLVRADPPSRTVGRDLLRDVFASVGHALACRLGAVLGGLTPFRPRLYRHIEHETSLLDDPSAQAHQEATLLSQRRGLLRAIRVPEETRLIDTARERSMCDSLDALRTGGDVVAVIGIEHLDPVFEALDR